MISDDVKAIRDALEALKAAQLPLDRGNLAHRIDSLQAARTAVLALHEACEPARMTRILAALEAAQGMARAIENAAVYSYATAEEADALAAWKESTK